MSWKEPKVEPSPGFFPVSEAEIKRKPDLKDLYLAVTSLAHHQPTQQVTNSPISTILGKFHVCHSHLFTCSSPILRFWFKTFGFSQQWRC